MSHTHQSTHLEDSVKNLLAFETHAAGDACPHCMTKHLLLTEELLTEESQQHNHGLVDYLKEIKVIRRDLPAAYKGDLVNEREMGDLMRKVRGIRLKLMERAGLPMHQTKHLLATVHSEHKKHLLA